MSSKKWCELIIGLGYAAFLALSGWRLMRKGKALLNHAMVEAGISIMRFRSATKPPVQETGPTFLEQVNTHCEKCEACKDFLLRGCQADGFNKYGHVIWILHERRRDDSPSVPASPQPNEDQQ